MALIYPNIFSYSPFNDNSTFDSNTCYDSSFRVDIEEKNDSYFIYADLPGLKTQNVKIDVKDKLLTVNAEFSNPDKKQTTAVHRERANGKKTRRFRLADDVNTQAIYAKMDDGLLTLGLPKIKDTQPQEIKIGE